MISQRFQPRRGFTLLEMLMALILLTVFALVAGEVFSNSMRALRTSSDNHNQLNSFENMLARLRQDAWTARSMRVNDPHQASLIDSSGQKITWSITPTGEFTRSAGADVCRWCKFDLPLAFAAHPVGLLLQQSPRPQESIILHSQFLAMERSRP